MLPPVGTQRASSLPEGETMTTRGIHKEGGKRKHPPAQVGQKIGTMGFKILAVLPRDRTSNERVRITCKKGHEREGYLFNFRAAKTCPLCVRLQRVALLYGAFKLVNSKGGDQ